MSDNYWGARLGYMIHEDIDGEGNRQLIIQMSGDGTPEGDLMLHLLAVDITRFIHSIDPDKSTGYEHQLPKLSMN